MVIKRPAPHPIPTQTSLVPRLRSPVEPPPGARAELVALLAALLLDAAAPVLVEVRDEAR